MKTKVSINNIGIATTRGDGGPAGKIRQDPPNTRLLHILFFYSLANYKTLNVDHASTVAVNR